MSGYILGTPEQTLNVPVYITPNRVAGINILPVDEYSVISLVETKSTGTYHINSISPVKYSIILVDIANADYKCDFLISKVENQYIIEHAETGLYLGISPEGNFWPMEMPEDWQRFSINGTDREFRLQVANYYLSYTYTNNLFEICIKQGNETKVDYDDRFKIVIVGRNVTSLYDLHGTISRFNQGGNIAQKLREYSTKERLVITYNEKDIHSINLLHLLNGIVYELKGHVKDSITFVDFIETQYNIMENKKILFTHGGHIIPKDNIIKRIKNRDIPEINNLCKGSISTLRMSINLFIHLIEEYQIEELNIERKHHENVLNREREYHENVLNVKSFSIAIIVAILSLITSIATWTSVENVRWIPMVIFLIIIALCIIFIAIYTREKINKLLEKFLSSATP